MSSHKTPSRSKKTALFKALITDTLHPVLRSHLRSAVISDYVWILPFHSANRHIEIIGSHLLNTVVLFETGKGQHLHVFFFCYFYRKIEKPDTRSVTNIQPFCYTLFYIINTLFSYLSLLLMILTLCYNHLRV